MKCPIVPVGIVGSFAAWNRHAKVPTPSPLFLPPGPGAIAISVGKPIDPARYEKMTRDEMLADLQAQIALQMEAARKLQRR